MENILKLFRKKSNSLQGLVDKFNEFTIKKADLVAQTDDIKHRALHDDSVEDLLGLLQDIRLQTELCDSACREIEDQLSEMLIRQIERDYKRLSEEKTLYDAEFDRLSAAAGSLLGQARNILEKLHQPYTSIIVSEIAAGVGDAEKKYPGKMDLFSKGYIEQANVGDDVPNFLEWRGKLKAREQLKPGDPATERHVKARVKKMLGIAPPPAPAKGCMGFGL